MLAELTARLRRSFDSHLPSTVSQSHAATQHEDASSVKQSIEAIEAEVTHLTWSVMDGVATDADKQRLKELVGRQHQARQTCENAMLLDSDLTAIFAGSH